MPSEILDPWSAIAACFQKYAVFDGRSRRSELWFWLVFVSIFTALQFWLVAPFWTSGEIRFGRLCLDVAGSLRLFAFVVALPTLAVLVRRLHDTNRSSVSIGGFLVCFFAIRLLVVPAFFITRFIWEDNSLRVLERIRHATLIFDGALFLTFLICAIVVLSLPGTSGDNKYGPDPRRRKPTTEGEETTNEDV